LFMIATPSLIDKGMKISLPTAISTSDISHITLRIAIDRTGRLFIDKQGIDLEGITRAAKKLGKDKVQTDAVILADKEVSHGRVMEIAAHLQRLGITQIGFGMESKL
jgi:biopolymer transport protein ExbD